MELDKTELNRLKEQAQKLINEHLLSTHFALRFLEEINTSYSGYLSEKDLETLHEFAKTKFPRLLKRVGYKNQEQVNVLKKEKVVEYFQDTVEDIHYLAIEYSDRLGFPPIGDNHYYDGPLCSYLNFLHPLLSLFANLEGLPNEIFLLVDDADNLSDIQKQVLELLGII